MKKLFAKTKLAKSLCLTIFVLSSAFCQAQTFIYPEKDSVLTEYNDGNFWAYLNNDNFVVGLTFYKFEEQYFSGYQAYIYISRI